jgi:hypothetical protein
VAASQLAIPIRCMSAQNAAEPSLECAVPMIPMLQRHLGVGPMKVPLDTASTIATARVAHAPPRHHHHLRHRRPHHRLPPATVAGRPLIAQVWRIAALPLNVTTFMTNSTASSAPTEVLGTYIQSSDLRHPPCVHFARGARARC